MIDITLEGFDVLYDLWGNVQGLKVFMAGNQWFVVPELLEYLKENGVSAFIETLPPGVVKEHSKGVPIKIGNLIIDFKPEIVSLPPSMLRELDVVESFEYVSNSLAVVYNKAEVKDWCSLKGLRVAIPNPVTEGIGQLFKELYEENCGNYEELSKNAYLTKVHHREIPKMLANNEIDAGVVWVTEAIYWKFKYSVPTPNREGKLAFGLLRDHSDLAKKAFSLLRSERVKEIYTKYDFRWIA